MRHRHDLALAVGLALAASCVDKGDGADPIAIGGVLSTTGDLASIGEGALNAAQLAIDEVNAAGGVLGGQRLVLINQDDATDPTLAPLAAQNHLDSDVSVFVGAIASASTLAAADVATAGGVVMISPASTSPSLTGYADDGFLFRTCPSDALQGTLLAQRALARGLGKAAILYVPGAYGEGMAETFAAEFEAGGGTVSASLAYVEAQSSYVDLWTTVFADPPDVVAMPAYPADGGLIVKDYLETFAAHEVTFLFGDSLATPDFVAAVGGADRFTFPHEGTAPSFTGPEGEHFTTAWDAAYPSEAGPFVSNNYDGTILAALAIHAAGETGGAAIRDSLQAVSSGGTPYGAKDLPALLDAISRGEDVDYVGASGAVDFDANGDVVAPYDIWEVDGEIVVTEEAVLPEGSR